MPDENNRRRLGCVVLRTISRSTDSSAPLAVHNLPPHGGMMEIVMSKASEFRCAYVRLGVRTAANGARSLVCVCRYAAR